MALRKSHRSLAALAVIVLVVASGCAAVQSGADHLSARQIGKKVQHKYEHLGTYTGTLTTKTVTGNETHTSTARVWANKSGDEIRYEYVSPASKAGTVLVSNGTTMWMYNETTGTARKTDLSGLGSSAGTNYSEVIENLRDQYDVSYEGTGTVGDRETYVISLTSENGSAIAAYTRNYTLWIGKDSWFPLKRHVTMSINNRTVESTMTYTNVTFDADVPADTFEFHPPEDANVSESDLPETTQYDSLSAVDANVSFDVSEPTHLPEGYEFDHATRSVSDNRTSVLLSYTNESDSVLVTQSTGTDGASGSGSDAETVSIRDHEGTYASYGSAGIVQWTCNGRSYSVAGSLSKETLLAVAKSVDCA